MVQYRDTRSNDQVFGSVMRKWFDFWLENLTAYWLQPYWNKGLNQRRRHPVKAFLGDIFVTSWIVFSIYNLYSCVTTGLIFRPSRHDREGWITYSEHPISFVLWIGIYSLPLLFVVILIIGHFASKRQHKRAAFKEFKDGSGPPPLVRRWNRDRQSRDLQ